MPFCAQAPPSFGQNSFVETDYGTSNQDKAILMAVGDIMMHKGNILGGYDPKTDSYDYTPYFEYVTPIFQKADWVFGNLETCLAGKDSKLYLGNNKWEKGYTAWPFFNAPEVLAGNLKDAGFTILSTANNHAMDRGTDGIIGTIDTLDKAGLQHTGTFTSPENRESVLISKKRGVNMAFFAYTYSTNGIHVPEGKEFMVNRIEPDLMERDFIRAREAGADCITCYLHFGREYSALPSEYQISAARKILDQGADIVLGSHPHVVQPYEIVTSENESKKVIIYSMGNFLSNMNKGYEDIGVIFCIGLTPENGCNNYRISDIKTILTRVYKYYDGGKRTYRIIPIRDMLENRNRYNVSDTFYYDTEKKLEEMERHLASMLEI
ncbi:MAG: CapA family protein [Candidatus Latescibacteria bacterium]|nr:CapA family protein [Candidatus Latescibacterota bacterium]